MFLFGSQFCISWLAPTTPNTKQNMTWTREEYNEAQKASWQTHSYEAYLLLKDIHLVLESMGKDNDRIAHSLHEINNSLQDLASAVRNLQ